MPTKDNRIYVKRWIGVDVVTIRAYHDESADHWVCVSFRNGKKVERRTTSNAWAEAQDMINCALD